MAGIAAGTVIRAWRDPDVEDVGFAPLSRYVETVWLPVAGPSATWAYRRLGALAVAVPDGVLIDLSVMARDLGLASTEGPSNRFFRALDRLERFGLLARFDAELWVRTAAPPVPANLLSRLSPGVQAAHRELSHPGS